MICIKNKVIEFFCPYPILISTEESVYVRSTAPNSFFGSFSKRTYKVKIRLSLTSGFREVFAKQKFGWSLQGGISKSLLIGETASRPTEGTV